MYPALGLVTLLFLRRCFRADKGILNAPPLTDSLLPLNPAPVLPLSHYFRPECPSEFANCTPLPFLWLSYTPFILKFIHVLSFFCKC